MSRRVVSMPHAPAAIGPYSQAIVARGMVFCSGQIPLDPATGQLIGESAAELEVARATAGVERARRQQEGGRQAIGPSSSRSPGPPGAGCPRAGRPS